MLNSKLETGLKTPMDEAILRHAEVDLTHWTKVDEVPFDFERRCVSVLADDGAPARARREGRVRGRARALDALRDAGAAGAGDPGARTAGRAARRRDAGHAARALRCARRRGLPRARHRLARDAARAGRGDSRDEANLVFAGFACFEDPPKP